MQRIVKADGWAKASYSGSGDQCVEVDPKGTMIRDSKNLDVAPLDLGADGFAALVRGLQ